MDGEVSYNYYSQKKKLYKCLKMKKNLYLSDLISTNFIGS